MLYASKPVYNAESNTFTIHTDPDGTDAEELAVESLSMDDLHELWKKTQLANTKPSSTATTTSNSKNKKVTKTTSSTTSSSSSSPSLAELVALAMKDNTFVQIIDYKKQQQQEGGGGKELVVAGKEEAKEEEEEILLTESHLKNIWNEAVEDEDDLALTPSIEPEEDLFHDDDDDDEEEDEDDVEEIYITRQELEALWEERSMISWGMPAKEYNDRDALLLVDDIIDPEEEGDEDVDYVSAAENDVLDESQAVWNQAATFGNDDLKEAIRRITEELDDTTVGGRAWKKDRHSLSPDVDTQDFMGDVMWSNTYLTQRIPANWADPEPDEKSDLYVTANSMSWPGQPQTDFNVKYKMWEALNLPIGPDYTKEEDTLRGSLRAQGLIPLKDFEPGIDDFPYAHEENEKQLLPLPSGDDDFPEGTIHGRVSGVDDEDDDEDDDSGIRVKSRVKISEEVENFFAGFMNDDDSEGQEADDDVQKFFEKMQARATDMDEEPVGGDYEANFKERVRKFKERKKQLRKGVDMEEDDDGEEGDEDYASNLDDQIEEMAANPEFQYHVGYDVWGNYSPYMFIGNNDLIWDDDVYYAQSIRHFRQVLDLYLRNHHKDMERVDEVKSWERYVNHLLLNKTTTTDITYPINETIPSFLTPDKHRGVKYSDELIEMKGKLMLHPEVEDPAIAYANDTFTPRRDAYVINFIGTIRDQYDWTPRKDLEHVIEEEKLPKLAPLFQYLNGAAVLQSTKNRAYPRQLLG
eukprot:scaffold36_cov191-Ochromonas_danica.AAC.12